MPFVKWMRERHAKRASHSVAQALLSCPLPAHSSDLPNVAVLVCAGARRQVAGRAKNTDAPHECVTGAHDRIRWDFAQKSILRTIGQRRAASEPGSVTMTCVSVMGVSVTWVRVTWIR